MLTKAANKRLNYLSFGVYERDLGPIMQRAEMRGCTRVAPPPGGGAEGYWMRDPGGMAVQIRVAPKCTPDHKSPPPSATAPAGVRAAPRNAERPTIRPLHFSHIAVFSSDVAVSAAFYRDVLGLQVADHVGEFVAFMRAVHGSDHHVLALAKSCGAGMHHCSRDVGSIDNVALGGRQMEDRGYAYDQAWGPGRHVIGSNYFYYVRDPWGSFAELTADIDYVEAGMPWEDRAYGPEDALYLWGPPPPPSFLANKEVEGTP